jgi:hypothetical protein
MGGQHFASIHENIVVFRQDLQDTPKNHCNVSLVFLQQNMHEFETFEKHSLSI